MPPLDFTSSENFVFATKIDTWLTASQHLVKNSTLPLKSRSTVSQKLGQSSKLKEISETMTFPRAVLLPAG
jgi:hypothetical protein